MLEISPCPKRGTVLPFGWQPMCALQSLTDEAGLLLFGHLAAKRKLLSGRPRSERSHRHRGSQRQGFEEECSIQQQTGSE